MKKSSSFPFLAASLVLMLCLASAPSMGGGTEAIINPVDIVNIGGRQNSFPTKTIYTVPSGRTLVIQGVQVNAASSITGIQPATLSLKCGDEILVPAEIMASFFGDVFLGGELGLVCEADQDLRLVGGPVAGADTVGWMVIGQLLPVTP